MASSAKSPRVSQRPPLDPTARVSGSAAIAVIEAAVDHALRTHVPHLTAARCAINSPLWIGLSGGIDSVVLLDCVARLARGCGWRVAALHVHHGLQRDADLWASFCSRIARARGITIHVERVTVTPAGEGIEAAARAVRHGAYHAIARGTLLLAHHRDDQAETVLFNLARGAGFAGLAGMPMARVERALQIIRPLLEVPRTAIEHYARARRLRWVNDPSNADPRYTRNALRHDVMPRLTAILPGATAGIERSARLAGETAALLAQVGAADAAHAQRAGESAWNLATLQLLGEARARNALRAIVRQAQLQPLSLAQFDELWRQLVGARPDANIEVRLQAHLFSRFRGVLWIRSERASRSGAVAGVEPNVPVLPILPTVPLVWPRSQCWSVPAWGGEIIFEPVQGSGLDPQRLLAAQVTLRPRVGGERIRVVGDAHHRTIKQLYQRAAVPPCLRQSVPLLYLDDEFSWLPGVGIAASVALMDSLATGWQPHWRVV